MHLTNPFITHLACASCAPNVFACEANVIDDLIYEDLMLDLVGTGNGCLPLKGSVAGPCTDHRCWLNTA